LDFSKVPVFLGHPVLNLVTVRNLVIVDYFLTLDNLYILVYL
jgi:hypothetical protein